MNKKVEIIIDENDYEGNRNRFCKSHLNGRTYTSVDYGMVKGVKYGGASPCISNEEINREVENAKEIIITAGDKPIVVDRRK